MESGCHSRIRWSARREKGGLTDCILNACQRVALPQAGRLARTFQVRAPARSGRGRGVSGVARGLKWRVELRMRSQNPRRGTQGGHVCLRMSCYFCNPFFAKANTLAAMWRWLRVVMRRGLRTAWPPGLEECPSLVLEKALLTASLHPSCLSRSALTPRGVALASPGCPVRRRGPERGLYRSYGHTATRAR